MFIGKTATEKVDFVFDKAVSKITVDFSYVNSYEKLRIYVNGSIYTVSPSEITSVTTGLTIGTDATGSYITTSSMGSELYSLQIASVSGTAGITSFSVQTGESTGQFDGGVFKVTAYPNTTTGVHNPAVTNSQTVDQLFGATFTDVDAGNTFRGVTITSAGSSTDATNLGKYQYQKAGTTTWVDLATGLTDTTSVYLAKTDLVRFVASSTNTSSTAKPDLVARLVDNSAAVAPTSGQVIDVSDADGVDLIDHNGGSTAYSGDTVTLHVIPDTTAPTLLSSSPADNGTVAYANVANNLTLSFSEAVKAGTGVIELYNASNTLVESFDVATSIKVTGWNGSTLTINPTADLIAGTGYYVKVATTAIKDLGNNAYAGITDATTLLRPACLAPYIAWSAWRSRVSASCSSSG